jgi:integrase/recombinase XerD
MEKIKMQPTRPEDALLTDAFADFLEKCRAKNLSEKTLNIYSEQYQGPTERRIPAVGNY